MKKLVLSLGLLAISISALFSQGSVSGLIVDATNGEELIGAAVYFPSLETGTVTDIYGKYSMELAPGTYTISLQFANGFHESYGEPMSNTITITVE